MKSRAYPRLLVYGAIGAAILVVGTVAVLAYQSLQVGFQPPTVSSPLPALECTPAPCANLQGYTLWVTGLNAQSDLVTMQITFRNSSDSTHAAPADLELIDSQAHVSRPAFDAPGCTPWSRHEFNHGATYGPITVCFRASGTSPPLVLRWSPDFGFTCCQTDIKLS
jgi:hypothetical protein